MFDAIPHRKFMLRCGVFIEGHGVGRAIFVARRCHRGRGHMYSVHSHVVHGTLSHQRYWDRVLVAEIGNDCGHIFNYII